MTARNLFLAAFCLALTFAAPAQETTQSEVLTGPAATANNSVSGTIVYVAGNDLVIQLDSGDLKDFQVPPGASVTTEDGTEIVLKDAKPGMRLTRTITTTNTPRTVQTIRSIRGRVWHVQPPSLVILTLPEGNKIYRVPEGQKFNVDGNEATVWDLHKGQEMTATVITVLSATVANPSTSVSAKAPPETPALEGALLVEEVEVAEVLPAPELPHTGSMVPLLGLCGLLLITVSLTWMLIRS